MELLEDQYVSCTELFTTYRDVYDSQRMNKDLRETTSTLQNIKISYSYFIIIITGNGSTAKKHVALWFKALFPLRYQVSSLL